jgi:hypothetical protein
METVTIKTEGKRNIYDKISNQIHKEMLLDALYNLRVLINKRLKLSQYSILVAVRKIHAGESIEK